MMRLVIGALLVLLLWLQWQLWGELAQVNALNQRLEKQVEANTQLIDLNDALFAEVEDLREGLEAIEERARAELGLIGEGESFYIIVDPEQVDGDVDAVISRPSLSSSPQSTPSEEPSMSEASLSTDPSNEPAVDAPPPNPL